MCSSGFKWLNCYISLYYKNKRWERDNLVSNLKVFLVVVNYLVKGQEREKNQKVNLVLFKDKAWKHTANIIKNCNKMLIDHLKLEMKWWRVTRFAQPRYWYLWCREPFCSPWIKLQHENTLTIYLIYSLYMYY